MLGATCYAHRHPDLLRSFCGGSLENCDVVALRTHFESDAVRHEEQSPRGLTRGTGTRDRGARGGQLRLPRNWIFSQ